jgi:hypothetical protein
MRQLITVLATHFTPVTAHVHARELRTMYPAKDARELAIFFRISRELDVVGDVTATTDNPSELLAWALVLTGPEITAWRAEDSGHRYVQIAADRRRAPIRGRVTAVLACERHREFWDALGLDKLDAGDCRRLDVDALSSAWDVMPVARHQPNQATSKRSISDYHPRDPPVSTRRGRAKHSIQ